MSATRRFFTVKRHTRSEWAIAFFSAYVLGAHGFWWYAPFLVVATIIDLTVWYSLTQRTRA